MSNINVEMTNEWQRNYLGKLVGIEPPENDYPDCCEDCSNNPKNGGSGICNCTLPYMQNPTIYTTNSSIDDCCMAATTNTGAYIVGKEKPNVDKQPKADANIIADAVARTKKYTERKRNEYTKIDCPECGSALEVYYDGPNNGDPACTLIRHCEKCLRDWESEWHEDGSESEMTRKYWG